MTSPSTATSRPTRPTTTGTSPSVGGRAPRLRAGLGALWVGVRRVRSDWRILLVVAVDLFLIAALLCGILLYTLLLADIQLQSQLAANPEGGRNVDVAITHSKLTPTLQAQEDQIVTQLSRSTLATFAPGTPTNYLVTPPIDLGIIGGSSPPYYTQLQLEGYQDAQVLPHIQILSGQPPSATLGPDGIPDALITEQMVQVDGAQIGDVLASFTQTGIAQVRVVGIYAPRDPNEPFWNGATFTSNPLRDSDPYVFPVLLSSQAMTAAFSQLPAFSVTQHWIYYTQPRDLNVAHIGDILAAEADFSNQLAATLGRQAGVQVAQIRTGLNAVLASVVAQERQFALPVESVGGLALGAGLLLLAVMIQVLLDRDRRAIASARSRGASALQLVAVYLSLVTGMGLLAVAAGAALAVWLIPRLVSGLAEAAAIHGANISSVYLATVVPPRQMLVPAVACLLLAMVIAVVVSSAMMRKGALELSRPVDGERARAPLWQRLYLDLWLAGLCVVAYLGLTNAGTLTGQATSASAASSDSSLTLFALAPVLLLAAGTLLLLRVFLFATRLWSWLALRRRGAIGAFTAMWLSRGGAWVMLKPLLVIVAMAVLALTMTFKGDLERTAATQAAYQAGADVRLVENKTEIPSADAPIQAHLAQLSGSPRVMPVWRGELTFLGAGAGYGGPGASAQAVGALAIDPSSWSSVVASDAWQPAYTSMPLSNIMAAMVAHEPQPADAPLAGAQGHPLWAIVTQSFAQTRSAKLGSVFVLDFPESVVGPDTTTHFAFFQVGAIVSNFPTIDMSIDPGGDVIVDEHAFFPGLVTQTAQTHAAVGPNEYWLGARGADTGALVAAILHEQATLDVASVVSRQGVEQGLLSALPVVGISVLMVAEALAIALLTLLAAGLRATTDVRQRRPLLASMRLLGVSRAQVVAILMGEQAFVVLFGVLAGLLVGAVLALVTLSSLITGIGGLAPVPGNTSVAPLAGVIVPLIAIGAGLSLLLLLQGLIVSVWAARAPIRLQTL